MICRIRDYIARRNPVIMSLICQARFQFGMVKREAILFSATAYCAIRVIVVSKKHWPS